MAIRHVARTHRISIEWLREVLNWPDVYLRYVPTRAQLADLMTKGTFSASDWNRLVKQTALFSHADIRASRCNQPRSSLIVIPAPPLTAMAIKPARGILRAPTSSNSRRAAHEAPVASKLAMFLFCIKKLGCDLCKLLGWPKERALLAGYSLCPRLLHQVGDLLFGTLLSRPCG